VLFVPATALLTALSRAHVEGRLEERLSFYAKPKLLIIDELGYLPFETNAAHLFFQLVSQALAGCGKTLNSSPRVGVDRA